jgi:hypothetical protein
MPGAGTTEGTKEMKKILISAAVFAAVCISAIAGLDAYGLKYTTLIAPSPIGVILDGVYATNSTEVLIVTNASTGHASTGVDISGLPGKGAILLRSSGIGSGTVSFVLTQCATTNGTYTTITNDSVAAYTVTNGASAQVIPFTPNAWSRYLRTKATVSTGTVTNGGVSATLVSY